MPDTRINGTANGASGDESDNSDPWDDELLIKAYNESVRLAKEDVAKKVASATNTSQEDVTVVDDSAGKRSLLWQPVKYKVGDFVRAVYRKDGMEYEAVVVSTSGGTGKCLIKFIGYENEQYVKVSELKESLGGEVRMDQIEASLSSPCADEETSVGSEEPGPSSQLKSTPFVPALPLQGIHMPPLPPSANDSTEEGKHLAAMLTAWYTSGYYTGLYDAHRMAKNTKS